MWYSAHYLAAMFQLISSVEEWSLPVCEINKRSPSLAPYVWKKKKKTDWTDQAALVNLIKQNCCHYVVVSKLNTIFVIFTRLIVSMCVLGEARGWGGSWTGRLTVCHQHTELTDDWQFPKPCEHRILCKGVKDQQYAVDRRGVVKH